MPLAGQIIRALDFTAPQQTDEGTDINNIADTTFVAGSTACSITFVAPTSGKVEIAIYCRANADSATNLLQVSFEVRETDASGTVVLAASANRVINLQLSSTAPLSGANLSGWYAYQVTGLTAGATYYAQTMHQVGGGSDIDIVHRKISMIPLP